MIVKSTRPGILMIPDAGIKLRKNEIATVEKTSPQMESAIKRGYLVVQDVESAPASTPQVPPPAAPPVEAIASMNATDAVARVGLVNDPAALKELLGSEKRKTVIDALKLRLQELKSDEPE